MANELMLDTSAIDDASREYHFQLIFYVFRESGTYIAYCPALDISTSGDGYNETVANFYECFQLYIETCVECGTLHDDLLAHGWKVEKTDILPPTFSDLMKKSDMEKLMSSGLSFERIVTPARLPAFA